MSEQKEPLFTPAEILKKTKENIESNIYNYNREIILLTGKVSALETILANIKYQEKLTEWP